MGLIAPPPALFPTDFAPAGIHPHPGERPVIEHPRQGFLQHGPPFCTTLHHLAAGDVGERSGEWALISVFGLYRL